MSATLRIQVPEGLYLRNPSETALGRKIVAEGIALIDEIGFERLTFKKLAARINSTEASIYRYFSSKHQFLKYLVSWYWNWLAYLIEYRINNVSDRRRRLEIAIGVLTECDGDDPASSDIDESVLHRIVMAEGARVYLTKQDQEQGATAGTDGYHELCALLMGLCREINPKYRYLLPLVTTLIGAVHKQVLFAEDSSQRGKKANEAGRKEIQRFLSHLVLTSLEAPTR